MARILLVEDNDMLRDLLAEHLENAGHEVVASRSKKSGIENYNLMRRCNPFQIAVIDISLPEEDGFLVQNVKSGVELVNSIRGESQPSSSSWLRKNSRVLWRLLIKPVTTEFIIICPYPIKKAKSIAAVILKGAGLSEELLNQVRITQIMYWRKRYRMLWKGMLWVLAPGTLLILEDVLRGLSFSGFALTAGTISCLILIYLSVVRPAHPARNTPR